MKNTSAFAAVADAMAKIDFCMMQTRDADELSSRPMSNNGDVRYDGETWFFSRTRSTKVEQIGRDARVQLAFVDNEGPSFICVWGTASVLSDVELKKKHWHPDLQRWFENGPEDPDVCLIRVSAHRIQTWGRIGDYALGDGLTAFDPSIQAPACACARVDLAGGSPPRSRCLCRGRRHAGLTRRCQRHVIDTIPSADRWCLVLLLHHHRSRRSQCPPTPRHRSIT